LDERLEDRVHFVAWDADPVVHDFDHQRRIGIVRRHGFGGAQEADIELGRFSRRVLQPAHHMRPGAAVDRHFGRLVAAELDGVAGQAFQRLADLVRIELQHPRSEFRPQHEAAMPVEKRLQLHRHPVGPVEQLRLELHASRVDFVEQQDRVDQVLEPVERRTLHFGDLGIDIHHLADVLQHRERCAELMRDVAEELAFHFVQTLEFVAAGFDQLKRQRMLEADGDDDAEGIENLDVLGGERPGDDLLAEDDDAEGFGTIAQREETHEPLGAQAIERRVL
jgi:hypothetical protein